MKDDLLASLVCTALMRVGSKMVAGFDAVFRRMDLTQAQFRTLLAIWEAGADGIAPSVLADRLLIERATVTLITTRLVDRGLAARAEGENRRTFLLRLTPAGEKLLTEAVPHAVALAETTLAAFGPDELRAMLAWTDRLEVALRAHDAGAFWAGREREEQP